MTLDLRWSGGSSLHASLREQMLTEGYFKLPSSSTEWPFAMRPLAQAVATLVRFGWHPAWILMYDEAWLLAYALHFLVQQTVNRDLQFNADFWAWYIDPTHQEKGWEPHRDRQTMPFNARGEPEYVTAWVPFTDATPENGCIYVVPASFDEDYDSGRESVDFDVQNVRALPAEEGSVLAWGGRTLHFGGRASKRAVVPRVALSMAFSTSTFEDPWLRLGAIDGIEEEKQEGESLRCNSLPPTPSKNEARDGRGHPASNASRALRVVATQHHLYESKVPIPAHISRLLEQLEDL